MRNSESDALVIFGITGDLAYRKIIPAIYGLLRRGRLPGPVIGVAREDWTADRLRASLRDHGKDVDEAGFASLQERVRYVAGDYRDPDTFRRLRRALGDAQAPLHYLAIPPSLFGEVVSRLDASGCARGARVVVEKPLGRNLATAQALNRCLLKVFDESREHEPRSFDDRARDAPHRKLFEVSGQKRAKTSSLSDPAGGHDG